MGASWRLVAGLVALLLASTVPARAEWLRAESPNFIVYSQSSEADLREQVTTLEDFDRLLRALTGARQPPSPNKLNVYMVRGIRELRIVRPRLSSMVGGFYTAQRTGIAAFVDERIRLGYGPRSSGQNLEVLFHEYAHHFMLQYFPFAYPAWYIEGFAEFMMYTRIDGPVIEYGRVGESRGLWLTQARWLPMERVLFEPRALRTRDDVALFYAQSWITVHYLFRDPARRAALNTFLTSYGRGEDPQVAFEAAFGMRVGQFGSAVQRYTRGRGIPVTRLTRASAATPPAVSVTRLPASAEELLLMDAGLRIGLPTADAAPYLARIRRLAAARPDDRFAMRVLARAEAFYGDGEAAARLLAPLLAEAPADAELLYLSGMRHLSAAQAADDPTAHRRQAQLSFARAHRAAPTHFPSLVGYAESLRGTPNYVSENTANILMLAQQLAPQVASIRFDAAVMMMNRDKFDEAEALLAPLAGDPHAQGLAERARELVVKARARERPGDVQIQEQAEDGDASDEGDEDDDGAELRRLSSGRGRR